jgi:hypothetical protein
MARPFESLARLCPDPGNLFRDCSSGLRASVGLSSFAIVRTRLLPFFFLVFLASCPARAQAPNPASGVESAAQPLITQAIDESQRVVLKGNTHPLARPQFDRGQAPAGLPMQRMMLVLKRSPQQEAALERLIDAQEEKSSPNYHQWLSAEQFGQQFGPAESDLQTVVSWLQSNGFQVAAPSRGRTVIEFSGTAGQVQVAFQTTIHKYVLKGDEHWANSTDPSIPAALAPAVTGIVSLHNFPRHSHLTLRHLPAPVASTPFGPLPLFTFQANTQAFYGLGPTDFATIYNVLPLWNAGIDGTGQTIAIVGDSNIYVSDVANFRTLFGLPANPPQIILNGFDPGVDGDETEALLDVSWSGAVAKNATIDLVVSASTEASLGVDLSALYIVDNNLAPIMSESFGECESALGNAGNAFYNDLWQQAAAQGITVLVSAGDSGSAGCDNFNTETLAGDGLAVSGFASTPYNVAVGGTDFNQNPETASTYWNQTNSSTTGASAKSYIPETTWNDSCAGIALNQCEGGSQYIDIVSGSGGPSSCSQLDARGNCLSGYPKPSWQTGSGVPMDGVRDLPDVSLFASNGFNNSFYIICEADAGFFGTQEACSLTTDTFVGIGGTSASAPTFAGIMALVNQKMSPQGSSARQGDANYSLYKLAAQSGASCNSSTVALTGNSCLFYDVTQGNDSVPCYPGAPDCSSPQLPGNLGEMIDSRGNPAWAAGPGYDLATGLGSVNVANLVDNWSDATFASSVTTISSVSPSSVTHGQPVNFNVTVAPQSGSGTPTGSVSLIAAPSGSSVSAGIFNLTNGVANGATTLLPGGTYNVTAEYSGDSVYGGSTSAPVQVTVAKENSQTSATLVAYNSTTRTFYQTNSIPYGTIFFLRSDVVNAAGTACSPSPQQSQIACPTGSVGFTLNGKTLDAGSYSLNTQGYTEDQTLTNEFTSLGPYAIGAQYSGDTSYNPSSASLKATVTQAPTTMDSFQVINVCCFTPPTVDSGQSFQIFAAVYAWSVLQAPTGTITILQNGAPPTGTILTNYRNGSFMGNYSTGEFSWAIVSTLLTLTINTPGTYNFTASYPGDAYYTGSQNQWPLTVNVLDTTFNITQPIPNVTISSPGQTGTAMVGLVGIDNFFAPVTVSCTLPAAMTEASCVSATVNLSNAATASLQITTRGPHAVGASRVARAGILQFGLFAGMILFVAVPGIRRRKLPQVLILFIAIGIAASCGGGSTPPLDPGTPPGSYVVNVTATSSGITRTGTFQITLQ